MPSLEKSLFDRAIGMKVRWARRESMMRRDDLARALSIEPNTIVQYESGLCSVPNEVLAEIAKVLNKPLSWFFEDISTEIDDGSRPPSSEFEECVGLLQKLRACDKLYLVKPLLKIAAASADKPD